MNALALLIKKCGVDWECLLPQSRLIQKCEHNRSKIIAPKLDVYCNFLNILNTGSELLSGNIDIQTRPGLAESHECEALLAREVNDARLVRFLSAENKLAELCMRQVVSGISVGKLTVELRTVRLQLVVITLRRLELSTKWISVDAESDRRMKELSAAWGVCDRVERAVRSA